MTPAEMKQFIAKYTDDVWNKHDVGAMDRYYDPKYVHNDVSRPDVRTLDQYRNWAKDLIGGLHGLRVDIDDLIAEENGKAVKRWTASGAHHGTLAGIPPTGKSVRFSGSSVYRIEGNRIVESWYVYDLLGLLQQLGVIAA